MMFSRAAKSIINSFASRQIHIGEKNFKIALIAGGAEEIGQTVSQLLRTNNKLNIFALYNVVAVNRSLPNHNTYNYSDDQRFKLLPSGMLMAKQFRSADVNRPTTAINNTKNTDNNIVLNLSKHQENNGRNQIQKLVDALYRLPIAEETSTLDSMMSNETISKAKRRRKNSSWKIPVAKENNHQLLPMTLLNGDKNLARGFMRRSRNRKIIANAEAHCITIGKSASWVIPAALSNNKLKVLHKISIHGRRHRSCFSVQALLARNHSRWALNRQQRSNILYRKTTRTKLKDTGATLDNNNIESDCSSKFPSPKEDESRFSAAIRANLEDGRLRTKKIANNNFQISIQSSASNVANRDDKSTRDRILNIAERRDWIERVYSSIKSSLRDLHDITIESRSPTTLDSYNLGNIFALNESIPAIDNVMSNSALLFARKNSKSTIRRKIEEFCAQRKNSLRKRPSRDDICNKRERSCKTAEKDDKGCQKREKCQKKKQSCRERKKADCSKKTLTKQRRAVCEKSDKDQSDVRDCTTEKAKEQPCTRRKIDDTCKKPVDSHKMPPCTQPKDDVCKPTLDSCKESAKSYKTDDCRTRVTDKPCTKPKDDVDRMHPCRPGAREEQSRMKPKDEACKFDFCGTCYKEKEKKFCTEPNEENRECRKSVYKNDKCKMKDKKCWQDKSEEISCDKREVREDCQETKKTVCKEKKKEESARHDCMETKVKREPCKKSECPAVVKAPDCPEDDDKKRG